MPQAAGRAPALVVLRVQLSFMPFLHRDSTQQGRVGRSARRQLP